MSDANKPDAPKAGAVVVRGLLEVIAQMERLNARQRGQAGPGDAVADLCDAISFSVGYNAVMECVLAALINTHPDLAAFGAAFHSARSAHGVPLSPNERVNQSIQRRVEAAVAALEGRCPVVLAVDPSEREQGAVH